MLKDKIYDLNDRGEIMWPALRDRLREARAGQHKLQIHQNPLPNHPVAHLEVRDSPSGAKSEPVTIHLLESDLEFNDIGLGYLGHSSLSKPLAWSLSNHFISVGL